MRFTWSWWEFTGIRTGISPPNPRSAWWPLILVLLALLHGCGGSTATTDVQSVSPASPAQIALLAQVANAAPRAAQAATLADAGASLHVDFETGMADWSNWGNAQVIDGSGVSGSRALVVGIGAGGAGLDVTGIQPGGVYHLSAQARVTDPAETLFVGVKVFDSAGVQLAQQAVSVTGTSYAAVGVDINAPANAVGALLFVWKNSGNGYGQVDELTFSATGSGGPTPPSPAGDLVTNGGFEAGMSGWTNWGNAFPASAQGTSGTNALGVGPAAGGAGQSIGGVPAGAYRLTANARVTQTSDTAYVGVNVLDAAGQVLTQRAQSVSSTAFTPISLDVDVPGGAASVLVYVWKNAGSGLALADDFTLAPRASSTPAPSTNLLANGGFENALAGWQNWGNAVTVAGQGNAGSAAARIGIGAGGVGQSVAGIDPGRAYRLSAQARVDAGSAGAYLGLRFLDAAGAPVLDQAVAIGTSMDAPVRVDAVAPPQATSALVYVWNDAGGYAFVDDVVLSGGTSGQARGVFIGNSLTYSVADPTMGWDHSGGMAASTAQTDFVHRASDALGLAAPWVTNYAALEIDLNTALIPERTVAIDASTPVTVQLGDNAPGGNLTGFAQAYNALLDVARRGRSLACVSTWWNRTDVDALIQSACQSHGGTYVYIGDVRTDPANRDRLDGPQYADPSVQSHPHDWSMAVIGQRVVAAHSR